MSTTTDQSTTPQNRGPKARKRSPLLSLARAEFAQFLRNRTLVFMGTVFPVGMPLAIFFISRGEGANAADLAYSTLEMFALLALLFVQYYSVLSMVTTRRGEGVLKRLRTGEAEDWHILAAPAVPGVVLTAVGAVAIGAVVYATGAPAPVNPLLMLLGLVLGLVLFTALALLTAAYTKDAEAAQITSIPVMGLAIVGMSTIRAIMPERYADIAAYSPFAGVSDLMGLGSVGRLGSDSTETAALDMAGTFEQMVSPVGIIVAWTIIAFALVRTRFRWDDRG